MRITGMTAVGWRGVLRAVGRAARLTMCAEVATLPPSMRSAVRSSCCVVFATLRMIVPLFGSEVATATNDGREGAAASITRMLLI